MTRIIVDPEELTAASKMLASSAVELADIGAQLQSSPVASMPPQVAADVGALMATLDALLDQIGANYHNTAVDLARRSVVASLDSLAAATGTSREGLAAQMGVDLVALGVAAPPTSQRSAGTESWTEFTNRTGLQDPAAPSQTGSGSRTWKAWADMTASMGISPVSRSDTFEVPIPLGGPTQADAMAGGQDGMRKLLATPQRDVEADHGKGKPMGSSEVKKISKFTNNPRSLG